MTTTSDQPSRLRHPSRLTWVLGKPQPAFPNPTTPKERTMTTIDSSIPQPLIDAIINADTAHTGPPTDCPRCGGGIPNDLHRGEYPGALSRWDNNTMICSQCGTDEAMTQFTTHGPTALKVAAIHPTLGTTRWAIFHGRSSSPDME